LQDGADFTWRTQSVVYPERADAVEAPPARAQETGKTYRIRPCPQTAQGVPARHRRDDPWG